MAALAASCCPRVVHIVSEVTDLAQVRSGSVGDVVHSHNGAGPYTRPRTVPFDPGTIRQTRVRNRLAQVSTAWLTATTQTQRDSWADYAAAVPVPSRLGGVRFLSGQTMFNRCNAGRTRPFMGIVLDAPVVFDLASFSPQQMNRFAGVGAITVPLDLTEDWRSEDGAFLINYVGAGQPSTINFFKGPWRFLGAIAGNSTVPPVVGIFTDPFGVPPAGPNTWGRQRLARADGRLSQPRIRRFNVIP